MEIAAVFSYKCKVDEIACKIRVSLTFGRVFVAAIDTLFKLRGKLDEEVDVDWTGGLFFFFHSVAIMQIRMRNCREELIDN